MKDTRSKILNINKHLRFLMLASCVWHLGTSLAWAINEITIHQVSVREKAPQRFELKGTVTNTTKEKREVTLRSQVEVFDRLVPRSEPPLSVFRKDQTIVLKAGETRALRVEFVGEGVPPKAATRIEPALRIRRQRVWNY